MPTAPGSDSQDPSAWRDTAHRWLAGVNESCDRLEPLAGDVSARRYFRGHLRLGGTAILVSYPAELRSAYRRFLLSDRILRRAGVPVPRIRATDRDERWMLIEDLGPQTLFQLAASWEVLRPYLETAVETLARIRRISASEVSRLNPPLDAELLSAELDRTWAAFWRRTGLARTVDGRKLRIALGELCAKVAANPAIVCHRDYMVRNLMPVGDSEIRILDHQDLRLGPRLYDLASLLNDSLDLSAEAEAELMARSPSSTKDRRAYHRVAAQRTLKALGTFVAAAEGGSSVHRALVEPALRRALRHLREVPETAPWAPSDEAAMEELSRFPFC